MKYALEGGTLDSDHPLPEAWDDYALVRLTGWTFDEIDEADAVRSDWLLEIAAIDRQVQAERHAAQIKAMNDRG